MLGQESFLKIAVRGIGCRMKRLVRRLLLGVKCAVRRCVFGMKRCFGWIKFLVEGLMLGGLRDVECSVLGISRCVELGMGSVEAGMESVVGRIGISMKRPVVSHLGDVEGVVERIGIGVEGGMIRGVGCFKSGEL